LIKGLSRAIAVLQKKCKQWLVLSMHNLENDNNETLK